MMYIDSLKASLIESFNMLKLESISMLALVSLRTLLFLYQSCMYAWFLPLGLLVGLVLELKYLLVACYLTLLIKAARPSIDLKRVSYWQQPLVADWIIFGGILTFLFLPQLIKGTWLSTIMQKLFFIVGPSWLPGIEAIGSVVLCMSPLLIVWGLFMLDAKLTTWSYIKAFKRAITMIIFNYPFFLVTYAILLLALSVGYLMGSFLVEYLPQLIIVGWLLLLGGIVPYTVCFITNFYVKRLHEQFSLYY